MELKNYISARVNNYRVMNDKLYAETRDLVEKPIYAAQFLRTYSPERTAEIMQDHIDGMLEKATAVDLLYNAEVKKAIADARTATLPPEVRNWKAPSDYQMMISNALAFLNNAGPKLTDNEAVAVLSPFFNDWDRMRMFERVIERNTEINIVEGNGQVIAPLRDRFPYTFAGLIFADKHASIFNEAEAIANNIFLNKRTSTSRSSLADHPFTGAYVTGGYQSRADEDRLIELAGIIDKMGNGTVSNIAAAEVDAQHQTHHYADDDNNFNWM